MVRCDRCNNQEHWIRTEIVSHIHMENSCLSFPNKKLLCHPCIEELKNHIKNLADF